MEIDEFESLMKKGQCEISVEAQKMMLEKELKDMIERDRNDIFKRTVEERILEHRKGMSKNEALNEIEDVINRTDKLVQELYSEYKAKGEALTFDAYEVSEMLYGMKKMIGSYKDD